MKKQPLLVLAATTAALALLATALPAEARGGHGGGGGRGGGGARPGGFAHAPGVRPGGYAPRYGYRAPYGAVLGLGIGLGAAAAYGYGYPAYPAYPAYPYYGAPVYGSPPGAYYGYAPGGQLVPCVQLSPPDAQAAGCPVPQAMPGYGGAAVPSTAPAYYSPG